MSERKYGIAAKIAVLSLPVVMYTTQIAMPVIGAMVKEFPDVNPELLKQILTIPNFTMMAVALILGAVERVLSRRTLVFAACAFTFIGGIGPVFFNNITVILIFRMIYGIGLGIVFPLASSLIGELFEGSERQQMMGLRGAVGTAAGIVFSLAAGYLAVIRWKYAFLLMLSIAVVFIIVLFKLPEPERKPVSSASGNTAKAKLKPWTYIIILLNIGYNLLMVSFTTNLSIVVVVDKVGDVAQAGIVSTLFTVGAFLAGLAFAKIEQIFKRYTVAIAVGLVGASLVMLLFVNSIGLFMVGGFIFGLGFGLYNPCVTLKVIASVDKQATTRAVSLYIVAQSFAQFLSPILYIAINKALGLTGNRASWMTAGPGLVVAAVVIILFVAFVKPKEVVPSVVSQVSQ
ncbi:MAG: MFS transporter [Clostridiales bacterium]|nr:MFS transporter [Eubacteriales bacterium]MDH7567274.1 MFS transporter [Clostridiales bacterium]